MYLLLPSFLNTQPAEALPEVTSQRIEEVLVEEGTVRVPSELTVTLLAVR